MNKFVESLLTENTLTDNGAITNSTSLNNCIDLFFLAGACREESVDNIQAKITAAYIEDRVTCLRIIFWAGDIRQGAGERRFFKIALNWLSKNHPNEIQNYLIWIPELSRWDVIFELAHTNEVLFSFILTNFMDVESKNHALLCKWLPRKQQYNNLADKIRRRLKINQKQYRQLLVKGTNVVENKMCKKQWNEINYSQVPSVALNKYNKAWYRNDKERFEQYIEDVRSGKQKINASVIFPHDIIKQSFKNNNYKYRALLNKAQITQWNALPNWFNGKENSIIPVCDTSGSMYCNNKLPISVSVALGLYISERNIGPFKDAFITFSGNPQMNYLNGTINERLTQLIKADWGSNTDLTKVFDLILKRAKDCSLKQEELPKTVLIISDMEFDECGDMTNFDYIKSKYIESGYKVPQIVFWNVSGRINNVPVTIEENGVALISGCSPSIMKSIFNTISPMKVMDATINVERYSFVN